MKLKLPSIFIILYLFVSKESPEITNAQKDKKLISYVNSFIVKGKTAFKGKKGKHIKIIAKKLGKLPKWHLGYKHEGRSWLFVDEIQIK